MADADEKHALLEDVELDYTVSFPKPATIIRWSKPPVVFLFGWSGCLDRYLSKYSAIYEQNGCITVRYTTPGTALMRSQVMHRIAQGLYELFDELDLKCHPLLFHNFSGNGCWLYLRLMQLIGTKPDAQQLKNNMVGLAFDSAPAKTSPYQSAQAITFALYPRAVGFRRQLIICGFAFFLGLSRAWSWFWSWFSPSAALNLSHYDQMLNEKFLPSQQLYLFSKADTICSFDSIERFIALQRKDGASTEARLWEDSPHCEHGRLHPQEYADAVRAFLERCMAAKGRDGSSTDDNGFEHVESGNL